MAIARFYSCGRQALLESLDIALSSAYRIIASEPFNQSDRTHHNQPGTTEKRRRRKKSHRRDGDELGGVLIVTESALVALGTPTLSIERARLCANQSLVDAA
jgi:hypothetical protein